MIGERKSSWAVTFKRLLEDNIKVHGVQSYNKHSKQEKTKDGKIIYHLQDMDNVHMIEMITVRIWGYHTCTTSDII